MVGVGWVREMSIEESDLFPSSLGLANDHRWPLLGCEPHVVVQT